jgi:hypothetical protein
MIDTAAVLMVLLLMVLLLSALVFLTESLLAKSFPPQSSMDMERL